jgi:hypothetical protein
MPVLVVAPAPRRTPLRPIVGAALAASLAVALCADSSAQLPGRQFYAAPNGVPGNDGTIGQPLDLDTALSSQGPVRPGDTVWLRGGVYRRAPGPAYNGVTALYVSTLTGTAAAPIVVRQYPGERATLDGNLGPSLPVLVVDGSYTWFWGFEITNSHPQRSSTRGGGVDTYGHHNRFINLVIHDTGQGVGFWATSQADDSEVYGSIISHVGWEGSDRGHGHSLYVQNANGVKRIVDNVMFEGFSFGVHAYTENGRIDNIAVTGNILFNHGMLSSTGGAKANILFAGGPVAQNPTISGNYVYLTAASEGRGVDVAACHNGRVQNNYLAGGTPLRLACSATVVTGNTTYGPVAAATQATYPANVYGTTPSGVVVGVRPNAYEAGRANIAVFNWNRQAAVAVDVGAVLPVGTRYELRDAQNFFGPVVASGVYGGGTIAVPMTGLTAAPVIGAVPIQPGHTGPEFGAFVLLPLGTAAAPVPVPLRVDAVSPASGPAGGGLAVTLSGSGFAPGASVHFGGVPAATVVVSNTTSLTAVAPPHGPGPVDVVVGAGGQQAGRPAAFRYDPVPPVLHAASIAGRRLSLGWQAGAATPVRAYGLVAGRAPGATEFGPFPLGAATTLSVEVAPGTYFVRILADTSWGLLTSNEIAVPVGVEASPGAPALSAPAIDGRQVTLTWLPSGPPSGYVVVARLTPAGPPVAVLPVGATSISVAAPPGTFYVSVVAVSAGGVSPESNQITVVVP